MKTVYIHNNECHSISNYQQFTSLFNSFLMPKMNKHEILHHWPSQRVSNVESASMSGCFHCIKIGYISLCLCTQCPQQYSPILHIWWSPSLWPLVQCLPDTTLGEFMGQGWVGLCKPQIDDSPRFNSLWSGDIIWHHQTSSPLVQIMNCCLMSANYCLNQWWHSVNWTLENIFH